MQILWILKNHFVPNNSRYGFAAINKQLAPQYYSVFTRRLKAANFIQEGGKTIEVCVCVCVCERERERAGIGSFVGVQGG